MFVINIAHKMAAKNAKRKCWKKITRLREKLYTMDLQLALWRIISACLNKEEFN